VLLNYHIGRLILSSLCVGDLVRLVVGGVCFAGPDLATLEGSSWTDIMTCTGGCGYSF